jgi:TP901 family phage tail tape measure protein
MAKKLKIEAIFRAVDRMTRPVTRMQNRIRRFSRNAKRNLRAVGRAADKIGKVMKRAVVAGIRAATVAAVGLGVAIGKIVKTGADFERTLVVAATKFPGEVRKGTAAFEELEAAARLTGKTTEFTAAQSAEALKFLGAAGLDVKQAIAVLPDVIGLATVAEVELAQASDMAVKSLGAFGLASDDAAENQKNLTMIMDVMLNTANSASQTLDDVFEAMRVAAPIATTFGQKVHTVGASIIGMARAGFVGEQAGTAYRNMMLRLTALTPKAAKEIKKLGVQLLDADKNLRDPIALMGDLSEALEGLGTGEQARRLNIIFGQRAIGPAIKLMQAGTEQLREFEKAGQEAGGSIRDAMSQIQDTTTGSMRNFNSAVEGVMISLFKLKDSAIKGVIDRVTAWIRKNEQLIASKVGEWVEWIIENFDEMVAILKKVALAAAGLFTLVTAVKAVNAAITAFEAIIALANPKVLLIIGIVLALAAAAYFVIKHWEPIKQFFIDLWDTITRTFRKAVDWLITSGPISWFLFAVALIKKVWKALIPATASIWGGIKDKIKGVVDWLMSIGPIAQIINAAKIIMESWKPLVGFFSKIWDGIVEGIKIAIEAVADFISPVTNLINKFLEFKKRVIREEIGDVRPQVTTKITRIDQFFPQAQTQTAAGEDPFFPRPRLVSPQEKFFREENMSVQRTEVTIRDETGRAEVTRGGQGGGFQLEPTGTF